MGHGAARTREVRLGHPAWCANLVAAAGVTPGERALVVVDEPLVEEGSQLAAAVRDAGAAPTLELWPGPRPVERLPRRILDRAAASDVSLIVLESPHAEEGAARSTLREATAARGGRVLLLGFVDRELLEGELSKPPPELRAAAEALLEELRGADVVRVRARGGTDLTLRVGGRPWLTDAGPLETGGIANYPNGEVFVAPHADGADGILVADLTIPFTVPGLLDEPVRLRFERGRVTSIEGGEAARMLRELVDRAGAGADVVAELGIGLNPAISPRGHVMLDEKAAKTAHLAIGRNTGPFGGDNEAKIHVDCVFSLPEIEVDGREVQLP